MRACGLQAQELNEQAEYEASDDIVAKPANHWMINDLVLFVDSEDVPRIPKQLFDEVTQIRVDGVPGPVYLGHLEALRQLFRIVLFIGFVFIIVLSFGAVYKVSSTNQTAAVVVGGFLPMILRMFLAPPPPNVEMGTVSFKSKMDEVIKNFSQYWPIHDMPFELIPGDEEAAEGNEEASASGEGNHPAGLDGCPNNNSVYVEGNGTARIVCGAGLYQGRIQEFCFRGNISSSLLSPSLPSPCGWLGSRVVSVLDSGAEGPGFKSQSRRCRVTVLANCSHPLCLCGFVAIESSTVHISLVGSSSDAAFRCQYCSNCLCVGLRVFTFYESKYMTDRLID